MGEKTFRIPHDLMEAAFQHPDVEKYTAVLGEKVAAAVNARLKARGINIVYKVRKDRSTGPKQRPYANVYPESTGETTPADWGRAKAYMAAAIGQYSK